MIRNIKALGLALIAVTAMSSVAVSAAQAAPGELHVHENTKAVLTATITPNTIHKLAIGTGSPVECTTASLEGTVENATHGSPQPSITVTEATVTATYSGCQFLGGGATVRMNGCKYKLVGTAVLTSQAQVIGCTAGKQIEIIAGGGACTITIGAQAALPHVTYQHVVHANTKETDAVAHATVSGIAYTRDGFFCPSGNASFTGTTTLRAFKDISRVQVTKHNHQYTETIDGEQVGLLGT